LDSVDQVLAVPIKDPQPVTGERIEDARQLQGGLG